MGTPLNAVSSVSTSGRMVYSLSWQFSGQSLLSVNCKQRFMDSHRFLDIASAITFPQDDYVPCIRKNGSPNTPIT